MLQNFVSGNVFVYKDLKEIVAFERGLKSFRGFQNACQGWYNVNEALEISTNLFCPFRIEVI